MEELNYDKFMIYLRKFQNKIQKEFNNDLKSLGITSTHVGIIMILSKKSEGYSMSELSRLISVDNALMTRNIKELEKIKYIYRNRKNESQRKYHICLTEEGKNIAKTLTDIQKKKEQQFLKCFTIEEQNLLKQAAELVICKFMNAIEKEEKEC